jgi:hypothetical protein
VTLIRVRRCTLLHVTVRHEFGDVLRAADEDGQTIVQARRLDIENVAHAVRRPAAAGLGNVRERHRLVQKSQVRPRVAGPAAAY